jgi:NAD(P)-dependent dehydrogenase (short-subunit alcohol dehydrogenase family)
MELKGRTAFITGGAQGIGLGIARSLARQGVKLALADIDADALARAKSELAASTQVETYVLDVRDRERFATVAAAVEDALGPVSLLFNNAGVASGTSAMEMSYEMWDWVFGINLGGVINGLQTFLPRMIARAGGGHIVNTSSGAGLFPTGSGYLYCGSKSAVVAITESLRPELIAAEAPIGISVLCPGPVATGIVRRSVDARPGKVKQSNPEALAHLRVAEEMLAAGATIDEVGEMVLTAIRDNALYIFTDRIVAEGVQERTAALLAAMPGDGGDEAPTASAPLGDGQAVELPANLSSFTLTEEIAASPEAVFAVIADPARIPEWSDSHKAFPDGVPPSMAPGSGFRQITRSGGSTTEVSWRVRDIQAPHTYELVGRAPMGINLHAAYSITPTADGSLLSMTTGLGGGPIRGPIAKLALDNAKKDQEVAIQKLKALFAW